MVIIVGRELAITGLRLLAASQQVVLGAERFGKHKTISQIVAIVSVLTVLSYPQWGLVGEWIFGWRILGVAWTIRFTEIAKWASVLLTLFSGGVYLWRNRALYLNDL